MEEWGAVMYIGLGCDCGVCGKGVCLTGWVLGGY